MWPIAVVRVWSIFFFSSHVVNKSNNILSPNFDAPNSRAEARLFGAFDGLGASQASTQGLDEAYMARSLARSAPRSGKKF